MIILYGIANCDTVKKARNWLTEHDQPYVFHDFKKQGVPADPLAQWVQTLGWEALLNRRGTTWRKVPPAEQALVIDAETAQALMRAEPSIIKRPVVQWPQGTTVGFDATAWQERL